MVTKGLIYLSTIVSEIVEKSNSEIKKLMPVKADPFEHQVKAFEYAYNILGLCDADE